MNYLYRVEQHCYLHMSQATKNNQWLYKILCNDQKTISLSPCGQLLRSYLTKASVSKLEELQTHFSLIRCLSHVFPEAKKSSSIYNGVATRTSFLLYYGQHYINGVPFYMYIKPIFIDNLWFISSWKKIGRPYFAMPLNFCFATNSSTLGRENSFYNINDQSDRVLAKLALNVLRVFYWIPIHKATHLLKSVVLY